MTRALVAIFQLVAALVMMIVAIVAALFRSGSGTSAPAEGVIGGTTFLPPIPKDFRIYASRLRVAGLQHRKSTALSFARSQSQYVTLEPEPSNPYDKNAIKVIGHSDSGSSLLGYVPRDLAARITQAGLEHEVRGRLERIYLGHDDYLEIVFQVIGPKAHFDHF